MTVGQRISILEGNLEHALYVHLCVVYICTTILKYSLQRGYETRKVPKEYQRDADETFIYRTV